jgi:hypothetical protein
MPGNITKGGVPGVSPAKCGSRVRSAKRTNGVDAEICRRPEGGKTNI